MAKTMSRLLFDILVSQKQQSIFANGRKCLGPFIEKDKCDNILNNTRNFNNVYCWNCLYNWCKEQGNDVTALMIADRYL